MKILPTLAVVGTVATVGLIGLNSLPQGESFMAAPVSESELAFHQHMAQYHRSYGTKEEFNYRLNVFTQNYHKIMAHNMNPKNEGFYMAVNKFTDLTAAEFKHRLGYKPDQNRAKNIVHLNASSNASSVDWRKTAVTPVKDQQQCGSCWAFSTTGSIEGAYAIKNKNILSFSEQNLVDCSTENSGCDGGLMDAAFDYVQQNGLQLEKDYPYTAQDGTCKKGKTAVKLTGHVDVTPNSPSQLEAAVALGPVSVAIEADTDVFQSYSQGVIKSKGCGTQLDHGVLVVGYGESSNDGQYWILKNSWGADWGEKGFFRVARSTKSDAGICGLQSEPSYPTL